MTFSEILAGVYADMNLNASPASTVVTRIKRYVNEAQRAILREPGLQRLVDSDTPLTIASVASTARYVLPESVARIHSVTERTNDRKLEALSLEAYRGQEPDPTATSGTPSHYVPIGRVAVATQPSDASSLFVKSTAAGDTTQTAYVQGLITGGYRRTASVTLTGTTAVTLAAAITTFIEVEDFYLSAAAAGTVTLHEDSGAGTELARVTIGQVRPRYYGLYLWPTPAGAVSYLVDYRQEITDLVNDTDEPQIPLDFHPMLMAYARMREYEKTDDSRYTSARDEFALGLSRLRYQTQWTADELPVMGRAGRLGRSRLGGYFPADHWN